MENGIRIILIPVSKYLAFKYPVGMKLKQFAKMQADIIPENYITGWDVVINQNEQIEIIEGSNHVA